MRGARPYSRVRFRGYINARRTPSVEFSNREKIESSFVREEEESVEEMERKNDPESQQKDSELMSLLEEPFGDPTEVERALTEIESATFALLDLLYEIWKPEYSAARNLRLILASVSGYMTQKRPDLDARRVREGREIKSALTEVYRLWLEEGPMAPTCSVDSMYRFVRAALPPKLYTSLVNGLMTQDTFYEWKSDYERFVEGLPSASSSSGRSRAEKNKEKEIEGEKAEVEEEEGSVSEGLDALFDLSSDQSLNRMPQHISRLEDHRLFTLKSPGEVGSQMIRVYVYDVKDIINQDKRDWWKHAKVRTQCFIPRSKTDRKRQLLRQLLDQVAEDLKKLPGVTRETRNLVRESGRGGM